MVVDRGSRRAADRVPKWSELKAWDARLAKRNGLRKAKVAVARGSRAAANIVRGLPTD